MFAKRIAMLTLAAVLACPNGAFAQSIRQPPTLRDRLVTGLQVRRPSEFAFIDAVIDTVERGDLPQKIVDGFFFWSRGKARARPGRRGIIYFQPALETQSRRLGIDIRADSPASPSP